MKGLIILFCPIVEDSSHIEERAIPTGSIRVIWSEEERNKWHIGLIGINSKVSANGEEEEE